MYISAQNRTDLDAVLAEALEAAASRVCLRAQDVIATARLATAVHMRQAAERALAPQECCGTTSAPDSCMPSSVSGGQA